MPTVRTSTSPHVAFAVALSLALVASLGPARAFLHDTPAADANEWVEFEGGRARLVASRELLTATAALEIDLEPGWKTYWIAPGPSGIPPELDASASDNVTLERVSYPAPIRFQDAYGEGVGYRDEVAFPLDLMIGDSSLDTILNLDATIGVCAELCVPVTLRFSTPLAASDPAAANRIAEARLALPGNGAPLEGSVTGERIVVTLPKVDEARDVFIAPPPGTTLGPVTTTGDSALAAIASGSGEGAWSTILRVGSGPLARVTSHEINVER